MLPTSDGSNRATAKGTEAYFTEIGYDVRGETIIYQDRGGKPKATPNAAIKK